MIEPSEEVKRVEQRYEKALDDMEKHYKDVLNKIRAEIDEARFVDKDTKLCKNANASGLEVAMQIIDKYKAESEGEV